MLHQNKETNQESDGYGMQESENSNRGDWIMMKG